MQYRLRSTVITVALAALALGACSKDKDEKPAEPTTEEPATDEPKEPAADEPKEPALTLTHAEGDYVTVVADHSNPKKGKVDVAFETFGVTEASFDPANLEGGTATLVIDLASLKTDSQKRDKHLRSGDYLEVDSYPHATVTISEVKKKGDGYEAKADVDVHGVTVAWPVTFNVVEDTADAMVVEGALAFKRTDIGVGAAAGEDDSVADEMSVKVRLTLPKPS